MFHIRLKNVSGLGFTIAIGLFLAGAVGYILNIVKLYGVATSYTPDMLGELVLRVVGIIPLLGAILGWL